MFFTQLSVGVLGLTPLVPWRSVGKGYYLMNLLVGLGLLPLGWFFRATASRGEFPRFALDADGATNTLMVAYGVLALLAVFVFWVGRGEHGARLTAAAAVAGWLAVASDGIRAAALAQGPAASPLAVALNYVAGAGVLGSVLGAMLLGHWYLVVKDLPVTPLKTLTVLIFGFLGLRVALLALAWGMDPAGFAHAWDGLFIVALVRVLFGLGCPAAMSWMIWGTVSIRSTQAATGILYGVSVFVLMGEAASRHVFLRTGFPL